MKTYEEMSNAVMEKVQIRKAEQKQRVRVAALCTAGMCCLLLTVAVVSRNVMKGEPAFQIYNPINSSQSEPTESTDVKPVTPDLTPSIKLLCSVSNSEIPKVLKENAKVPYKAELRVRDIIGMTEDEKERILEEENAYVRQFLGENIEENLYSRYMRDNVIVTMISAGELSISFDDIETVERAQISVTENGYIFYPRISGIKYTKWDENGLGVEIDGNSLRKGLAMLQEDDFVMHWSIAPSVANRLNEDPDMEMAQISDYITITVAYTDGRVETKTVVVQVCDDGQITMFLLEGTTEEQQPGKTLFVAFINDLTQEANISCVMEEEKFYEEGNTAYYFNSTKSQHILVGYNNGMTENVVVALRSGRVKIADLDKFGIEYYTKTIDAV